MPGGEVALRAFVKLPVEVDGVDVVRERRLVVALVTAQVAHHPLDVRPVRRPVVLHLVAPRRRERAPWTYEKDVDLRSFNK